MKHNWSLVAWWLEHGAHFWIDRAQLRCRFATATLSEGRGRCLAAARIGNVPAGRVSGQPFLRRVCFSLLNVHPIFFLFLFPRTRLEHLSFLALLKVTLSIISWNEDCRRLKARDSQMQVIWDQGTWVAFSFLLLFILHLVIFGFEIIILGIWFPPMSFTPIPQYYLRVLPILWHWRQQ